jgi:hypothetical protein
MTAHFINIGQGESVPLEFPCGAMLMRERRTPPPERGWSPI